MLELSSFQLETIETFRAHIGVALNITPDHLDRHYTLEQYAAAKARLFENQQRDDFAVLNADDPITRGYAERSAGTPYLVQLKPIWFKPGGSPRGASERKRGHSRRPVLDGRERGSSARHSQS